MAHREIIQGGMGVGVSGWRLARAVSLQGGLGVVSGTALSMVLARRLQEGDPDGSMRRALAHLPLRGVAQRVIDAYHVAGGLRPAAPFRQAPMATLESRADLAELTIAANFAEVFLAKEGHGAPVGLNLLEKVQLPTLASLYGAMLAGVDYVLMGAGIPRSIPGALDRLAAGEAAELRIDVAGALPGETHISRLDPAAFDGPAPRRLIRPLFLAIVSSATLALTLAKKSNGRVDGFVVEGELAGGHNAPPRGPLQLDASGQPVYGPRDVPDLEKIREIGLPFWLAGSYGRPERLALALSLGAAGIQVGTPFAFCEESGMEAGLKRRVLGASRDGTLTVFTDPAASPTGFPFKVVAMAGTLSQPRDYDSRRRVCDIGLLRQPYRRADGSVGYRCPGEPVADFVRKGGSAAATLGRKCLCNGLAAAIGLGQRRADGDEQALVTAGDEVLDLARLARPDSGGYSAGDVLRYLRGIPGCCAT